MREYIQKHITITDLPEAFCGILTGYREWMIPYNKKENKLNYGLAIILA